MSKPNYVEYRNILAYLRDNTPFDMVDFVLWMERNKVEIAREELTGESET